ncbi:hypothetical protein GCM10023317_73290 [Actinopolymorpha pittospori]
MGSPPIRLKTLLQLRHWQTYRTFCSEYDKAAKVVDSELVGKAPSRAQLHRWLSGDLQGLPYPFHCRVLEQMFTGFTARQLFERCPPEEAERPPREAAATGSEKANQLLGVLDERLEAPTFTDVAWGKGQPVRGPSALGQPTFSLTDAPSGADLDTASDAARTISRRLLELQKIRRFSDDDMQELASLAGHVVELAETIHIDIEADGQATVVYGFDLLNLSNRPLARVPRDIWFQCVDGESLAIEPTAGSERRVAIQRIHDTADMSKFAFQVSPPIKPGETARVGYSCRGGKFDVSHYWRQFFPRFTRHFTMRVRQKSIRLGSCSAIEERPDGSEESAADTLIWDYEGEDAIMTLTRDYLRPNQYVSLHWDVIREPPGRA